MTSPRDIFEISLPLNPQDWHGYTSEQVWASAVGDGRYKLENTPFFAHGLALGDVVRARKSKGKLLFEAVMTPSGHATYRIIIEDEASPEEVNQFWGRLDALGCTCEDIEGDLPLFSIDVPPGIDLDTVRARLQEGEDYGVWSFEEACCPA
ncbi:DUF4265 domain-containing protein [Polycladidibacter hongkongensis]|uniref:DUF4265 domain-containing protein n=1 Tax=Polycladidibacter hongkongensis TaxID=1647556 RepID=UPI000837099D|nr:DUF4265 domain-containing protein [Pseudovibrio hongkongensis]